MNEYILPKGTLIKINGIPFLLKEDSLMETNADNYKLFLSHDEQSVEKPVQAASPDK